MKKRKVNEIILLVFAILVIGVIVIYANKNFEDKTYIPQENQENISDNNPVVNETPIMPNAKKYTIRIYPSEFWFYPRVLRINQGDTVMFVNEGTETHWPASNPHITHDAYPESNINKCGTAEESKIFDACRGIAPDENYSFTFYEKGTWRYHDHLRASIGGTIIVD